jgi:hypothetical protein
MDLSRHKSHPVFSSLPLSFPSIFLFAVCFLLEVDLCLEKFYLWEELDLKGYFVSNRGIGWEELCQRLYSRLTVCKDVALEVFCFYFCVFIFSLRCYLGLRGTGDRNFCKRAQGKYI